MPSLLVISSAPVTLTDGKLFLDTKFVEGMRFYAEAWDGPVSCMLKNRGSDVPFGQSLSPEELPFTLHILEPDQQIGAAEIREHDVIMCGGDSYESFHLAKMCREMPQKLVFTIENILESRLQSTFIERARPLPKKIYSALWILYQEARRRRAFKLADGLQANGYPAFNIYRAMNANAIMYIDNRVGEDLLVTDEEMQARAQWQSGGGRLRLIHSGRLEPLKGSQDLIPIARRLAEQGVDFELNIFGSGSLEEEINKDIIKYGLQDRVMLKGVVDFETELVPFARANSDIYLSCHRQSDPSCTYLESMGCGLAVAGYGNRMWSALCQDSGAGWVAPMGNLEALADGIAKAAQDRKQLTSFCQAAQRFATAHSFEREFHKRIDHLAQTLQT